MKEEGQIDGRWRERETESEIGREIGREIERKEELLRNGLTSKIPKRHLL